jgi:hypothetical protein
MCLEALETRLAPSIVNWSGQGDRVSWRDPANWDSNQLPGPGDDVVISSANVTSAVVHSQGIDAVNSLTGDAPLVVSGGSLSLASSSSLRNTVRLTGGSLTGAGDLQLDGLLVWTGGTMDGTGITAVAGGASLSGSTGTLGRTLDRASVVTLDGPFSGLSITASGTFNNSFGLLGAEFDIGNNGTISGAGRFVNNTLGTLRRAAGTGTATIQSRFDSIGIVQVDTGTLRIVTSGSNSQFNSAFGGAAGTTIEFVGGNQLFGPSSFISAPNITFSGGTVTFGGFYFASESTTFSGAAVTFTADAEVDDVGHTLTVSAGSVSFNNPQAITVDDLVVTGGTLTGSANLTATLFFWSGGTLSGSGVTDVTIDLAVRGAATLGRALTVHLTAEIAGPFGSLTLSAGAVLNYQSSDPIFGFFLENGGSIFGSGTFNNQPGSVVVTDVGTETIQAVFNKRGEVHIGSGTLNLSGGGTHSGSFQGMPGATLQFSGGAHQLQNSSSITVPNVVFSGGTANLDGTYTASAASTLSGATVVFNPAAAANDLGPNVTVSAGSVTFNAGTPTLSVYTWNFLGGTITGSESFNIVNGTWQGGNLAAGGTLTVTSFLDITGGTTLGRTLTVADNAVVGLEGPFSSLNLQNGAVFTVMYGLAITNSQGITGSGTINCNGIVQVFGNTTIQGAFNNAGSVTVTDGTLHLSGGGNESGSFSTDPVAGGSLDFASGTYDFQASASITVPNVSFSGGTVNLNGTYDVAGNSRFTGATVTFNPGITVTAVGALTIAAGVVTFGSGQQINPASLFFTGGRLTGTDDLTVSGLFSWFGGTMDGTGITTADGGMDLDSFGITLGRRLTNNAVATWTGIGDIAGTINAVFDNGVNGTFSIRNDQTFSSPSCLGVFNNHGRFTKTASYGTTTIGLMFDNDGTVDIETGTVNFLCGGPAPSGRANRAGSALASGPIAGEAGVGLFESAAPAAPMADQSEGASPWTASRQHPAAIAQHQAILSDPPSAWPRPAPPVLDQVPTARKESSATSFEEISWRPADKGVLCDGWDY